MGTQSRVINGPASRKPVSGANNATILIHCEEKRKEGRKKRRKEGRQKGRREDLPRTAVKA